MSITKINRWIALCAAVVPFACGEKPERSNESVSQELHRTAGSHDAAHHQRGDDVHSSHGDPHRSRHHHHRKHHRPHNPPVPVVDAGVEMDAGTVVDGGITPPSCLPLRPGLLDNADDGDIFASSFNAVWYSHDDGTGIRVPEPSLWTPTAEGDAGSGYAACTSGTGLTDWGGGVGLYLFAACSDVSATTGVRFRARGTGYVVLEAPTVSSTSVDFGGTCTLDCDYSPFAPLTLGDDWQSFEIPWSALQPGKVPFSPSELLRIQFTGKTPEYPPLAPFGFDFCVDDIEIY